MTRFAPLVLVVVFALACSDGSAPRRGVGGAGLTLGVTHTQFSIDAWEPAGRRAAGERALAAAPMLQNQHLMGWGADNPEPWPGRYSWDRLDERMDLIRRTGGTPVLTLCCAPDWMKGGVAGQTDWARLEEAPTAGHYADFAALAAATATRYPQIRYFQVWNELKGFWNPAAQRWNAEAYTDLYNAVYDAVKRARPDAELCGPYVELRNVGRDGWSELTGPWGAIDQRGLDVITYWTSHKHGAEFVTVDTSTGAGRGVRTTDPVTANGLISAVSVWVRQRTGLPVWWSELYPDVRAPGAGPASDVRAAITLDAVAEAAEGGAAAVLLWQPEATPDLDYAALWAGTGQAGSVTTPLAGPWTWLAPRLRANRVAVHRSRGLLRFVAPDGTLSVNITDRPATVGNTPLAPWKTLVLPR